MAVLGVAAGASWEEVRRAFRSRIREVHPDIAGDDPVVRNRAVLLTQAYDTLERATEGGRRPLTRPTAASSGARRNGDDTPAVLHLPPGEVFPLLLDAAHRLGDVSYVSPDEGIISVLVRHDGGPLCQLVATIEGDNVAFSLDPMTIGEAPPIHAVVGRLAGLLRSTRG